MVRTLTDGTGAQAHLGYVVEFDQGNVRLFLDIDGRHTNRNGHLHGGLMGLLLDSVSGYVASLANDPETLQPTMTVSMNVSFLSPGRGGRVTATAKVAGGGRSLKFVDGALHDEAGVLLATSTGVFKMLKGPPAGDG